MKLFKRNLSFMLLIIILFSFSSTHKIAAMDLKNEDELSKAVPYNLSEETLDVSDNNLVVMVDDPEKFDELLETLPKKTIVSSFENNQSITVSLESEEELDELLRRQGISSNESEIFQDQEAYLHKVPYDQYYRSHQWNLRKVNMEKAWDFPLKREKVVVAVVDSGVTPHLDMMNVINGADLSRGSIREDTYPGQYSYDGSFHGTAVASGIASEHNTLGIAGINPTVSIMGVKVFADGTEATPSTTIAAGITWAADHGADIINLSVGTDTGNSALSLAVKYAVSKGILLVASTGNEGHANRISFPAAYSEVLAVGSTNAYNNHVSSFSNRGAQLDLVAPGESIILPNISRGEGNYSLFNGTSFSAPMVSGAASILLSVYPNLTSSELESVLKLSARDIHNQGWDSLSGHGILDVENALMLGKNKGMNEEITSINLATSIYPNKDYQGYLKSPLDYNVYKVHLYESYDIEIKGAGSSELDLSLKLLDENQKELKVMNSSGKGQEEVMKTYLTPGTYYVRVDEAYGRISQRPYSLRVNLLDEMEPQVLVFDQKKKEIPHEGLSKTATIIQVKDTSSFEMTILHNENSIKATSEVSEEGNYEIIAVDSSGNTTYKSFVLDSDGYLNVSFDAGEDVIIPKSRVYYGTQITTPEVLREGYVLKKWFREPKQTNEWIDTDLVKKNMTLYAQWIKREMIYESIEIVSYPKKTTYTLNEPIDLSGVHLQGRYGDGRVETVPVAQIEVEGFDGHRTGEQTVILRVDDAVFTYNIKVISENGLEVLSGESRFGTAAAISFASYKTAMTAVLVQADNFPDALSAGPIAYALGAPILLTGTNQLNKTTSGELKRLGVKKIIIMGGEKAISRQVEQDLKLTYGYDIKRVAGSDRYHTAVLAGKYLEELRSIPQTVILSSGIKFADALSAGSFAAKEGFPILLTDGDKLSKATSDYFINSKIKKIIIVGGSSVVEDQLEAKLKSSKIQVQRLSGADRSATAVEISRTLFSDTDKVVIANGLDFADALAAAPYAAKLNSPILLVNGNSMSVGTESYLKNSSIRQFTVVGGEKAVGKSVKDRLIVIQSK